MTSTLELLRSQLSDTEDIESDLALLGLQNKVADSSLEELAQKILAEQDHGEGLETPLLSKNKDYTETPAIFDQSIDTFIDVCKQQQEAVSVATKEGRKPPVVSCAQLREKKLPDWLLLSKGKV